MCSFLVKSAWKAVRVNHGSEWNAWSTLSVFGPCFWFAKLRYYLFAIIGVNALYFLFRVILSWSSMGKWNLWRTEWQSYILVRIQCRRHPWAILDLSILEHAVYGSWNSHGTWKSFAQGAGCSCSLGSHTSRGGLKKWWLRRSGSFVAWIFRGLGTDSINIMTDHSFEKFWSVKYTEDILIIYI